MTSLTFLPSNKDTVPCGLERFYASAKAHTPKDESHGQYVKVM